MSCSAQASRAGDRKSDEHLFRTAKGASIMIHQTGEALDCLSWANARTMPLSQSRSLASPSMLGQEEFLEVGHQLIELVATHLYQVRERPPYRPVPQETRQALAHAPLPAVGVPATEIVRLFEELVLPYPTFGTAHPLGLGWIAGGPDPLAVLATMLAAVLNPNCIGGDQAATYLELGVLRWLSELVGFPTQESAGLLVSGGTQATLIGLMVARQTAGLAAGWNPRQAGLQQQHRPLVVYASDQAHHCVQAASEVLG